MTRQSPIMQYSLLALACLGVLLGAVLPAVAEPGLKQAMVQKVPQKAEQPAIAIIIDDLGYDLTQGKRAVHLPGAVTLSFLPRTPHAAELAEMAHVAGKEVMLHLPMESRINPNPGPGCLTREMTEQEFLGTLHADLDSIPHVVGVNNHMGSRLTSLHGVMGRLMQGLGNYRDGRLFFIDSRTTVKTVAEAIAREHQLPTARRDVFLDNLADNEYIRKQFRQLIGLAKKQGSAIAIGHPRQQTMDVLKTELARLSQSGVRLVPASELIRTQQRNMQWQAPSSPSLKVAKNSKP